ncbi:dipeptidase [Candidatus Latescibacterota bacterium]
MKSRRAFLKRVSAGGFSGIIASRTTPVYAKNVRSKIKGISLEQAQKVHNECLIIDGHNDVPVETVARGKRLLQWHRLNTEYNTDIIRMREGGYDSGVFIVACSPKADMWITIELLLRDIETHPDDLLLVKTSNDVIRARKEGKIAVIMGIEIIGYWAKEEINIVRLLYRLGVRWMHIIYVQGSKSRTGPCTPEERKAHLKEAKGLTPFGFEVLNEVNRLGMVPDVSHINDRAFYEVIEHTIRPPVMSHTAVFSLCNHFRCMTDDQIKALAEAKGVMGITFVPQFIDADPQKATIDRVTEHICYVADLVGIDHVGIGSDFDGIGSNVPVVPDPSKLVLLTKSLLEHGMNKEDIRKIWGGNFLRILQQNTG